MLPKELETKLNEAIQSGKYFITISCKTKEGNVGDLQHYWMTHNYPKEELTKSLDFIKDDVVNKEIRPLEHKRWE